MVCKGIKDIFHSFRILLNAYAKISLKKSRRKPKSGLDKHSTQNMDYIMVNSFIYFAVRIVRSICGFGFVGKMTDKTLKIWVYHRKIL